MERELVERFEKIEARLAAIEGKTMPSPLTAADLAAKYPTKATPVKNFGPGIKGGESDLG